jgi:general secretion pathway protein B
MSYILEALKKSQQERELGQVPTLVDAPVSEARRLPKGAPWGPVAVALAAVAVAIALYAALSRVGVQPVAPPTATAGGQPVARRDVRAPVPAGIKPARAADGEAPPQAVAARRASGGGQVVGSPVAAGPELAPQVPGDGGVPATAHGTPPELAASEPMGTDVKANQQGADSLDQPISGDWMDSGAETGTAVPADEVPAAQSRRQKPGRAALTEPEVAPIPEDLRRDVEAFKDELHREQTGGAPRPAALKATPQDPTKLRLPLEVETRLPAFFMTVHIYDTVTTKRFVVINSLKYREGETTREGLTVEEIVPDGVVLGFEGHKFFRRR